MKDEGGEYEVGYGKPPRRTRFRKGQSGNPRGRPRGSRNTSTLVEMAFNESVFVNENGKRKEISKREAVVKQLANKAASGELRWAQMALEELRNIEAKRESSASNGEALETEEQAERARQMALVRQLSVEERRQYLDLAEKMEELQQRALARYQGTVEAKGGASEEPTEDGGGDRYRRRSRHR